MNKKFATITFILVIATLYPSEGYIVDNVNGDDSNSGENVDNAFKTIGRCAQSLMNPGDECQIRAGYYHEVVTITGLKGTKDEPIKILGYEDERPILDGTVTIQPNQWNFDEGTGICSTEIDQDIFALFYKNNLMTPARWPNAKWSDKTVFDNQHWRPNGCCKGSDRGLIVDDALAEANMNFTEAMAILNVGSWITYVREVLSHEPGSNSFTYYDDFGDIKFVGADLQYYLEAKFELLDGPEEWFYDKDTKMLYFIMPDNADEPKTCPETDEAVDVLRGRTVDNVLELIDSNDVTVANMTFWASNIIADDTQNSGIILDSLIFKFPSSSHRMLKDDAYPKHTQLWGNDNAVINCTFEGSEGPALVYNGGYVLVQNNEFTFNDWVGQGNFGTLNINRSNDRPGEISQNSFSYNGDNIGIKVGGKQTNVTRNHIEFQCFGFIKHDGASVQVPSVGTIETVTLSYNWIHDSRKKGLRFDGNGDPMSYNGYMGFNVVWNIENEKEMYPKGENNTIENNVAWDDTDQEECTICVCETCNTAGVPMNTNSIVINNGASKFSDGGGVIENNYESQDVKEQMIDTSNYDFRPLPGGGFISPDGGQIIGAYTSGESSLTYWIPGRRLYKTSKPIPLDGATISAADRIDVICQTGYLADQHDFYFGEYFDEVDAAGTGDDAFQMTLNGDENIFSLPYNLSPDMIYYWRVDARRGDDVYKGDVWSFGAI